MGDVALARQILAGVKQAIATTGETVTFTRSVTTPDPANPTRVITTDTTYTAEAAVLEPRKIYRDGTVIQVEDAEVYIDLLSILDDQQQPVNTPDLITVTTQNGDVVTAGDGTVLILLDNRAPRIAGRQVAAFHDARR